MSNDPLVNCYIQCPRMVLYGLPEYSPQEKWVLLSLMGLCWDRNKNNASMTLEELEGPYKLSLREIATLSGVHHTTLRTKGIKKIQVGILDRWQEAGYITIMEAQPIDPITDKPGHKQTYLYIHLRIIWEDNKDFAAKWSVPNKLVDPDTLHFGEEDTVDPTDSKNDESVDHTDSTVDPTYTQVDHTYDIVGDTDETVGTASSNSGQEVYRSSKRNKEEERTDISFSENNELPAPLAVLIRKSSLELGEDPDNIDNVIKMVTQYFLKAHMSAFDFRHYTRSAMEKTKERFTGQNLKSRDARFFFFGTLKDSLVSTQRQPAEQQA